MLIDPRGARFAAWLTVLVLSAFLLTDFVPLLAVQTVVFATGALFGMRYAPYGVVFRRALAPRLGPPDQLEAAAPPRFAQAVGLVFMLVALAGVALGASWLTLGAVGMALVAAFLNAAFDFCLGCETYLLAMRLRDQFRARPTTV